MGRRSDPDELVVLPARAAGASPVGPTVAPATAAPGDADRRARPAPVLAVVALLAALVAGGALTGVDGRPRHTIGEQAAARPPAPALRSADEPAPAGWRRGSPGPLRHRDGAAEVWTGRALVVWGGDPDGDTGAAYDPATDRWRPILTSTIPARCGGTAAWTGHQLLVWGPACSAGGAPAAAAFTPADPSHPEAGLDRWRTLPAGPLPGGTDAVSAWTGREWLVVTPAGRAAAFDPNAGPGGASEHDGAWRALPGPPRAFAAAVAAWTGRELLVAGSGMSGKGPASAGPVYRHWAAALDPAAGRWRSLPDPPLELAATAVWDGRRLVAWDQNLHAAALDPAVGGGGWRRLPDLPVEFTDCTPEGGLVGGEVFAEECGRAAVLHPATDVWERIPHPRSLSESPVWTGRDALFWTGRFPGSADGVWLYRPPAGGSGADGRHRPPVPLNGRSSPGRAGGSPGGGR